jgi:hypothetical protein
MPLVLIFTDCIPKTYPHSSVTAGSVVSTYGPVFAKDVVFNQSYMIVNKEDDKDGTAATYSFARDSSGVLTEIARNTYNVNSDLSKGSYSVSCLRNSNGVQLMENVLQADHEGITCQGISAVDSSQNAITSIGYAGIQFSTSQACMYFGESQQFRIRYGSGEAIDGSNILAIESSDGHGGYQTRISFTDALTT